MTRQEALHRAIDPARRLLLRDWSLVAMARGFRGARALEPGGPSRLFEARGAIPVYPRLSQLDVLDYAEQTLWTESPGAAPEPRPAKHMRRVIGEAGSLTNFATGSYDALLSSHVIEHLANPIGALREWQRVVRPGGRILIVAPHLDGTFDHRRAVTTLEHLFEDAARETDEGDTTHIEEVLALHDLERDPGAPDRATFERRARENQKTRGVHHHTFTSRSMAELLEAVGLPLVALKPQLPFNIICLCQLDAEPLSRRQLERTLAASPFPSDRR
ncbi:MAG TPA: methyltransferase domain-containing protein [Solirubrobacteraceae bacterium]|nr:methyltransferase domain-containing protein [Solirubrobacteraceae bacterium]